MATIENRFTPLEPVHPTELIKDELKARGMQRKELAEKLGMKAPNLSRFFNARESITPSMALKLEGIFGIPAEYWIGLQVSYERDLEDIKKRGIEEAAATNELADYDKIVNVGFLIRCWGLQGIPCTAQVEGLKRACKSNSAAEMQVAFSGGHFRKSDRNDSDPRMVNTWVLIARGTARDIDVGRAYDPSLIQSLAQKLRDVFMENVDTLNRVRTLCSDFGVRFAVCEGLPHTKIDGYSFIEDGIPAIVITNRYKRIDSLAFNILHELGHLASSPSTPHLNLENYSKDDPEEKAADAFANNVLIPLNIWKQSPEARMNPRSIQQKITIWAEKNGINKWIALGRVSYETGIYAFSDPQKTRHIQ